MLDKLQECLNPMVDRTQIVKLIGIIFPISGSFSLLASVTGTFQSYQFINKGLRIEGQITIIGDRAFYQRVGFKTPSLKTECI